MKKIILVVAIVVALGAVAAYFLVFQAQPQDPKELLGLWQKESTGEFVFFLEFKESELCVGGSGRTPESFVCNQYLPYSISEDTLILNNSPYAEWKVGGGKLELKSGQDKNVYFKVR